MKHSNTLTFQIGKNGLTEGTIQSLELAFKHHKHVRISVLKSATRDREELEKMAQEIQQKLSFRSSSKVIGYTIILTKEKAAISKPKKSKRNL